MKLRPRIVFWLCANLLCLLDVRPFAQTYYYDSPPYTDLEELRTMMDQAYQILDSLSFRSLKLSHFVFLERGDDTYMLPDGLFDVFHWENDRWKNLYRGTDLGYNFRSSKFIYENRIYSLGGYGYWRMHGDLICFSFDTGTWDIVELKGSHPPGTGLCYVLDSTLWILHPLLFFDGLPKHKGFSSKTVGINLQTHQIQTMYHPIQNLDDNSNFSLYELDRYYIILNKPVYRVDKQTGKIYWTDATPFKKQKKGSLQPGTFHYLRGTSIELFDQDFKSLEKLDIEKEHLDWRELKVSHGLWSWWYLLIPLLPGVFFFFLRKKRQKSRLRRENGYNHPLLPLILVKRGQILTADEIDLLLELSDILGSDNLRYRRAAIINEINLEMKTRSGKALIQRIQDPADKRRFLYRID